MKYTINALLIVSLCAPLSATERAPNVVFLLADDLGWTGLTCFGSDLYQTPHLDRLAADGMKFTNAYSACTVCSPTRASIMTGMYPARMHLTDFIAGQNRPWAKMKIPDWTKHLNASYVTMAESLQSAGYATAHVGKWHLSRKSATNLNILPIHNGFDVQHMKPKSARGYFLPDGYNKMGESRSDYLTDYLTDKALEVIDAYKDKPFFLYFAYHTPHTPIQGRSDLVDKFKAIVKHDAIHTNPTYAAMVSSLDQSVGRIRKHLKKHGLDEHTIIIFTSDNGGLTQRYGKRDHFTENLPLRRGKGSAYEGGVRVPTIIHWPAVTKPGSICHEPIMSIDYYPTVLGMTKAAGDATHNSRVDGTNLSDLLRNPKNTIERNLYWHYPHYHAGGDGPYSAIRAQNWRLIEFHEDNSLALYDIKNDIGERKNLADEHPEITKQLHHRLQAWRNAVGAQMPSPNPEFDPQRAMQVKSRKQKKRQ